MDDDDEYECKLLSNINCISHVEVKEEVIIPENTSDSESTLSDNENTSDIKLEECTICCKYRSMFIILKNHDCQSTEENCIFCTEISHWSNCFKTHKESHDPGGMPDEHSSDSTASDREESEEKCKVCLKYEFMVPLLKSHVCKKSDKKCQDCSEALHWTMCYEKHVESHKTKESAIKVKEENSSDSTTSDNEEIQKFLHHTDSDKGDNCQICLKYQVMLIIMKENHTCDVKKCDKCCEILQWYDCFENHKKTHSGIEDNIVGEKNISNMFRHPGGKFDCGICLKLNSIVTCLVKNHTCGNNKSCSACQEASFWLSCLKNHKRFESKSDSGDASDEEIETVKSSWQQTNCAVCSKFDSTISNLSDHVCRKTKGREKCEICSEISFWSKNYKRHQNQHSNQSLPLKNFLSCSNCGKRFSGEKMLNVHKSYCKRSDLTCEICSRQFLNVFALKKHKILQSCRTPNLNPQYICYVCKKSFTNFLDFKNHEKFHTELKNFKCKECFTEFKSEFSLKKHKHIHR